MQIPVNTTKLYSKLQGRARDIIQTYLTRTQIILRTVAAARTVIITQETKRIGNGRRGQGDKNMDFLNDLLGFVEAAVTGVFRFVRMLLFWSFDQVAAIPWGALSYLPGLEGHAAFLDHGSLHAFSVPDGMGLHGSGRKGLGRPDTSYDGIHPQHADYRAGRGCRSDRRLGYQ